MAFQNILKINDVINFEKTIHNNFKNSQLFYKLNTATEKNGWNCKVELVRKGNPEDKNYTSYLIITPETLHGEMIQEKDEPLCSLMNCTPVCYKRFNKIIGINLLEDDNFIEEINKLTEDIKSYNT